MRRIKHFHEHYYINSAGERRTHGIFAPGIDRFILIDENDFWITLETAEILSSKLPTVAYILPNTFGVDINNANCINFTIVDKTQQKIGPSPIAGGRQNPMLRFLRDNNKLVNAGFPEDFKDNEEIIRKITQYAQYVHRRVYAINMTDALYNFKNNYKFADRYLDPSWTEGLAAQHDRSSLDKGVFFELRKILYLSDTPEEAEQKITEFWANNVADQGFMIEGYYRTLNLSVPEQVEQAIEQGLQTISPFLF